MVTSTLVKSELYNNAAKYIPRLQKKNVSKILLLLLRLELECIDDTDRQNDVIWTSLRYQNS
jgi:hypothetical protein